jgi:hypothetical protein
MVISQPSIQKRMVMKIEGPFRLTAHLGPNDLSVVSPWFETKTKRVQHHDPLGFDVRPTANRRAESDCYRERNGVPNSAQDRAGRAACQKRMTVVLPHGRTGADIVSAVGNDLQG